MSDYPKPHVDDEWTQDIAEDYRNARSDEERRRILLKAGYDQAHKSEVKRLFDDPLELENRIKHEKKQAVVDKLKKRCKLLFKICGVILAVLTFFSLLPGAWDGFLWLMDRIRSIF